VFDIHDSPADDLDATPRLEDQAFETLDDVLITVGKRGNGAGRSYIVNKLFKFARMIDRGVDGPTKAIQGKRSFAIVFGDQEIGLPAP
jgi:hypothetical protein